MTFSTKASVMIIQGSDFFQLPSYLLTFICFLQKDGGEPWECAAFRDADDKLIKRVNIYPDFPEMTHTFITRPPAPKALFQRRNSTRVDIY